MPSQRHQRPRPPIDLPHQLLPSSRAWLARRSTSNKAGWAGPHSRPGTGTTNTAVSRPLYGLSRLVLPFQTDYPREYLELSRVRRSPNIYLHLRVLHPLPSVILLGVCCDPSHFHLPSASILPNCRAGLRSFRPGSFCWAAVCDKRQKGDFVSLFHRSQGGCGTDTNAVASHTPWLLPSLPTRVLLGIKKPWNPAPPSTTPYIISPTVDLSLKGKSSEEAAPVP